MSRFIISLFILASICLGQNYFPMHMGDWWEFYNSATEQYSQYTIVDTPTIQGNKYYTFEGYPLFIGNYRVDSSENLIWFWELDSTEITEIKLNSAIGDTWKIGNEDPPIYGTCVGIENNVKHFRQFQIPYYEDDMYFQDGVGLITYHAEGASSFHLTQAYVNGVYLLDIIDDPTLQPNQYNVNVFPNPFNSSISIQIDNIENVKVGIYDLLGNKVRELQAYHNNIVWNGKDKFGYSMPSGTYFVRLDYNSNSTVRKITLLK
ncbi:MAG: T9SS type A sorting domain-containing protein [Fidelibacterota bacterium]